MLTFQLWRVTEIFRAGLELLPEVFPSVSFRCDRRLIIPPGRMGHIPDRVPELRESLSLLRSSSPLF
jgi:hypothetical protein